ncbi:MAG: amidase [bacterium]
MDRNALPFAPITELVSRIASSEVKPTELLESCIARTESEDPSLNAFITRTFDLAREQAAKREDEIQKGQIRGPLHGIPVAIKDLFDLEGFLMTAGSRILKDNVSTGTAECVRRIIEAGAVIVGKTNLQEFARGGTGANSFFGPTRNPWNLNCTPGGSSSGSAAAVAAGMTVASLGSDTGGSVRLPASYCNLVGIRSTYGRVSRAGAVPLGLSFDNAGPIARTVEDAAILLQAIAGPDPADPSTGSSPAPDFRAELERGVKGLTFGVPTNHFWPGLEPEVEEIVRGAITVFENLGGKVIEVEVPWARLGQIAYAAVVGPESAEYHRVHLRERREEYISPGADFFEQSLFIPGWRYVQAQRARTLFIRQAAELFRSVDAILTPTSAIAPPTIEDCLDGMKVWSAISDCTAAFSTIGNPVLQVPCGFTKAGLPVGIQIAGRWGEESLILGAGAAFEKSKPLWKKRPPEGANAPIREIKSTETTPSRKEKADGMFSSEEINRMAEGIGHRVAPNRLEGLTDGVNQLMARMEELDHLDLGDCERAETIHLLQLKVQEVPPS